MAVVHARGQADVRRLPENLEETRKLVEPGIEAQNQTPRRDYNFKVLLQESNEFIGLAGITD